MRLRTIVVLFVILAMPSLVTAQQTGVAQALESKSFLHIILAGAGVPGIIIGILSLFSVTCIIEHFWTIRRSTMAPEKEVQTMREMIEARQFKECIDWISKSRTMFADVLTVGLRHGRHGFEAMQDSVEERANAWTSRLFRKVEYLNIIGNLCPLMGLLGTVLGMIEAFGTMSALHGGYKPEDLAGGISLALVCTYLGLVVAMISLGFYGVCRNRVDSMTVTAHAAVVDLLEYFRPTAVTPIGPAAINMGGPVRSEAVKTS